MHFPHVAPMSPSYDSSVRDDCFYLRGCPAAIAIADSLARVPERLTVNRQLDFNLCTCSNIHSVDLP